MRCHVTRSSPVDPERVARAMQDCEYDLQSPIDQHSYVLLIAGHKCIYDSVPYSAFQWTSHVQPPWFPMNRTATATQLRLDSLKRPQRLQRVLRALPLNSHTMERANENAQGSLGAERSCFVRWDELPPVDDEPPKNWVFLADIVENQTFMTTATYSIRDIAGRKLLLSVYPIKPTGSMFTIGRRGPDGRMQFDIPIGPRMEKVRNMQGGTMVAVKNCFAHWFMDGNVGVRLNEEDGDLDDFKASSLSPCRLRYMISSIALPMHRRAVLRAQPASNGCGRRCVSTLCEVYPAKRREVL
ncbi:hypothetical protein EXIGLDRAFT_737440 [Exidia glandulosa HHB12029]|uniref:Uncharacterized protein n=1 Tax=Exidia glandulosa HHB12029 TaxID=1314781 RepID=A0A166AQC2_EXIGL|nr:hypothetical protein EXIGLDRAFT_737440 [Exidia glandulosa HHB12029]